MFTAIVAVGATAIGAEAGTLPAAATGVSLTDDASVPAAAASRGNRTRAASMSAAAAPQSSGGQLSAVPQAPARTLLSTPPRPIRDFVLTTEDGKSLRLSQLSGAPVLVFFGFAHCPSICPAALTQLRLLEIDHAKELSGTRIVVISVDGERDTPSMLSEWLKPISPTFIGLTGPTNTVHDIAAQFSAAFFKGQPQVSGDYLVEHNSQVFLLDAQGRMRATFFDAPVETLAQITQSVAAEGR